MENTTDLRHSEFFEIQQRLRWAQDQEDDPLIAGAINETETAIDRLQTLLAQREFSITDPDFLGFDLQITTITDQETLDDLGEDVIVVNIDGNSEVFFPEDFGLKHW